MNKRLRQNPESKISFIQTFDIRNYIMGELVLGNATCSSNIIEFWVDDFHNAVQSELPNAMEISSDKYKTTIIYGRKILHFPLETFSEFETHLTVVRPKFVAENNHFYQMNHNIVSRFLNTSFHGPMV